MRRRSIAAPRVAAAPAGREGCGRRPWRQLSGASATDLSSSRPAAPRRGRAVSTLTTTERPGRSRPSLGDVGRHGDADRHALHDLGEVAGGVLRRQQAEDGARGRRDALDRAGEVAVREGVDRDVHLLAGLQPASCVSLKLASTWTLVSGTSAARRAPGCDDMSPTSTALLPMTPSTGARISVKERSRSALSTRGLQFRARRAALRAAAPRDLDIGLGGRRAPPRRSSTAATAWSRSARAWSRRRLAGEVACASSCWRLVVGVGAGGIGAGGIDLRRGLRDGGAGRVGLAADAGDRALLGRDLVLRGLQREAVVAVVDAGDEVAGLDALVVGDGDGGDIAGDLGGEDRHVGLHVGVVGRDHEAAVVHQP